MITYRCIILDDNKKFNTFFSDTDNLTPTSLNPKVSLIAFGTEHKGSHFQSPAKIILLELNISKEVNVIPIFLCSNFINEAEILLRQRNFKMVEQVLNYRPLSDRKLLLQHKIQKDFLSNFNLLDTSIEVDDYLEDLNKCTEKYVISVK